jgi:hypothetical protein
MEKNKNNRLNDLQNYEVSFDLEKEWDTLSNRLDQKKKRTGFLYYLLPISTCSLIAIIFTYSNYFMTSVGRAEIYSSWSESAPNINSPELSVQVTPSPTQTDGQSTSEKQSTSLQEGAIKDNIKVQPNSVLNTYKKTSQHSSPENESLYAQLVNRSLVLENKEDLASEGQNLNTNLLKTKIDTYSINENSVIKNDDINNRDITPNKKGTSDITPNINRLINLDFLPTMQLIVEGKYQISYADSRVVPAKKHSIYPWFLGLNFGVGMPSSTYLSNNIESDLYKEWRQVTERPLESFHGGFMIGKFINKNFYFTTGVQLHRINEQFTYNNELTNIDMITGQPTSIYENFRGDIDVELGLIEKRTTTQIQKRKYNNFQSWSVPIKIGYMLPIGSFGIALETGVIYQFAAKYEGEILRSDLFVAPISEVTMVKSSNLWLENSLGIYKPIGKDYILGLQTSIRNTLQPINHKQDEISQHFRDTNLRLKVIKLLK